MGGTICLHSLAVAPEFQKLGLGTILLKSYIQRMKDARCAERIALLAHDHLVPFYTSLGFENMGASSVTSCGSGWKNMVSGNKRLAVNPTVADRRRYLNLLRRMTTRALSC
jgi:GNAT superfamily N-acetyltransferase